MHKMGYSMGYSMHKMMMFEIQTKLISIVLNPAHVPCYGMSTPTNKLATDF